jgi:hypothetical protein
LERNRRLKGVLNGVAFDADGGVAPVDGRVNAVEPGEAQDSVFSMERCCGERAGDLSVGDGKVRGGVEL